LEVESRDPTPHSFHAFSDFNNGRVGIQLAGDRKGNTRFTSPEVMVEVDCDVHPWMVAFVGVMEHPFFGTTREEGVVVIDDLPAGTYTMVAWHEKYGEKEMEVTVSTGETKDIEFTFSRDDKKK
jgi:hypothetical protein